MEYKIGFVILIMVTFIIPVVAVCRLRRIISGCPDCKWKGYWCYHSRAPEGGRRSCGRCGREEVEDMLGWSPANQNKNKQSALNTWVTPILGSRADNRWRALALDFDLVRYGDTPEEAVASVLKVVCMQIKKAQEENDPSTLGGPSEQKYFDLFREANVGAMLNELFHCNDHGKEGYFCATLQTADFEDREMEDK